MKKLLLIPLLFLFACNSGESSNHYIVKNTRTSQNIIWEPMYRDKDIVYIKGDTVIQYSRFLVNDKVNSREDKCIVIKKLK